MGKEQFLYEVVKKNIRKGDIIKIIFKDKEQKSTECQVNNINYHWLCNDKIIDDIELEEYEIIIFKVIINNLIESIDYGNIDRIEITKQEKLQGEHPLLKQLEKYKNKYDTQELIEYIYLQEEREGMAIY